MFKKFRVWDEEHKTMIYEHVCIDYLGRPFIEADEKYNNSLPIDGTKVTSIRYYYEDPMQWIGKHDRYGDHVYEKDIIKAYDDEGKELIFVATLDIKDKEWYSLCTPEIIGNTYANSNLLVNE